MNIQHPNDAFRTDLPFVYTGEKAVPPQVVHPIHVELTGNEVMQEAFGVVVIEDFNGRIELPIELFVESGHDQRADFLMVNASNKGVFQGVTEGPVANIVKQNGETCASVLLLGDDDAFLAKRVQGLLHQVQGANSMVKTVVHCAWINQVAHAELADSTESLNPRMIHDIREVGVAELNEAVYGVVQQLGSGGHARNFTRFFALAASLQNNCDELPLKEP